jgi:hypothetical protein
MSDVIFEQWGNQVSTAMTKDALWKLRVYRLALFLSDVSWQDISILNKTIGTQNQTSQLYRAVSSIGANVAEGFSRYSPIEGAKFYE